MGLETFNTCAALYLKHMRSLLLSNADISGNRHTCSVVGLSSLADSQKPTQHTKKGNPYFFFHSSSKEGCHQANASLGRNGLGLFESARAKRWLHKLPCISSEPRGH